MSNEGDTATDQQLVELFTLDSVAELEAIAAGKGGALFIDTHDGQWAKYEGSSTWRFIAESEGDEP